MQIKKQSCCGENKNKEACTDSQSLTSLTSKLQSKKNNKTRITIKYDVGFSNALYLRGSGANLSWDKGIPLKNLNADEWVWETELPFTQGEFKVLINDKTFEVGENHLLLPGASICYTPIF